jgi:hypothetical protein
MDITDIRNHQDLPAARTMAIYHRVFTHEGFETAAQTLFRLVTTTQEQAPDAPRQLYLDIDGHRNENGGFTGDMLELQREFVLGFLLPYLTEVHMPLIGVKNKAKQRNDMPDRLEITQ